MADENVDININTVVNRESLDELNGELSELSGKAIDLQLIHHGLMTPPRKQVRLEVMLVN